MNRRYHIFNKENKNTKQSLRFHKKYLGITVNTHYDLNKKQNDIVWNILKEWASTIDNKLSLTALYIDGAEFKYEEESELINIDYIVSLLNQISEKYAEIAESLSKSEIFMNTKSPYQK